MTYSLLLSPQAFRDLEKLDSSLRDEIITSMEKLKEHPQYYAKKLRGLRLWSLRAGKYRVIFEVDDGRQEIRIHAVGHRKKVYKEF